MMSSFESFVAAGPVPGRLGEKRERRVPYFTFGDRFQSLASERELVGLDRLQSSRNALRLETLHRTDFGEPGVANTRIDSMHMAVDGFPIVGHVAALRPSSSVEPP